jgi:hypothetical protein
MMWRIIRAMVVMAAILGLLGWGLYSSGWIWHDAAPVAATQ